MSLDLNITQESLSYLVASIVIFIFGFAILARYRGRSLRHLLFMGLGIVSIAAFALCNGLSVLLLSPPLILARNLILIPLALFIVGFLDSITRDSTDPVKLAINVGLSVALLIYNSDLNTVGSLPFPNGDASLANTGVEIQAIKFALLSWLAIVAIFTYVRIYLHSPRQFRKYIMLSLFGLICIGPGGIFVTITVEYLVPGSIAIVLLVGSVAYALGIILKMNLAFVLPFRAIRLMVFTTDSGIPLFTHTWPGSALVEDVLFSGMIQGVSGILKESLSEGEMEEIKLTNAVLIVRRAKDVKIACVLASTKSSKILRGALDQFLQRFLMTFSRELKDTSNVSQFDGAKYIVTQTFPFIPAYD
ncbi:MAG: hypothetical protein JW839_17855 [Candidatus Lokiarchaeota archaeon]|nr:hypothetical protein [Candidatus Lokiarchaeota archaeon]